VKGSILGWDVGGANIKAVLVGENRPSEAGVIERPFPLWRERERLPAALVEIAEYLDVARRLPTMAVTMTAELADCFASKREGVAFVLDAFHTAFPGAEFWVYGVDGRFRSAAEAKERPLEVAAANWRASATLAARVFPAALFIDVGSTTTDIIPIVAGHVAVEGTTDPARLQSGELVYTGALRTPICAIVRSVPFGGRRCRVAAEHFAVVADVQRWLDRIDEEGYACETPDGRGRSRAECGARIARMICADLEMLSSADITGIARHVARAQLDQIKSAIRQVMRRVGPACPRVAVLAGQGAFLARSAAEELGLTVHDLAGGIGTGAARAAPAAAVAYLLGEVEGLDMISQH
jgi:(4-(4-[2-(gamma-L-glutamylamino)ethyl]phenoxymethyl)furan-2-yl)methanamine synthase